MPPARAGSRGNENDNRDGAARDRAAARRARRAARLRLATPRTSPRTRRPAPPRPCTTCCGGSPCRPRAMPRASRRRCRPSSTPRPTPFALEAHDWAFYTEKVRAAEYDLDRARAASLVRGRARAAGRRVPRRDRALRHHVRRAHRPVRLPPRRPRVRDPQRRRLASSGCSCSTSTPATPSAAAPG